MGAFHAPAHTRVTRATLNKRLAQTLAGGCCTSTEVASARPRSITRTRRARRRAGATGTVVVTRRARVAEVSEVSFATRAPSILCARRVDAPVRVAPTRLAATSDEVKAVGTLVALQTRVPAEVHEAHTSTMVGHMGMKAGEQATAVVT